MRDKYIIQQFIQISAVSDIYHVVIYCMIKLNRFFKVWKVVCRNFFNASENIEIIIVRLTKNTIPTI